MGYPDGAGYEQATARVTPDGGLELRVGIQSHGQSLETTLAQVANEVLGIDIAKIKVVHGDTEYTPYSTGTWGSRCIVMAGGAVARASQEIAERLRVIGANLLQADPETVRLENGQVVGPQAAVSIGEGSHVVPAAAGPALRSSHWRPSRRRSATDLNAIPARSATPHTRHSWQSTPRSATSRS